MSARLRQSRSEDLRSADSAITLIVRRQVRRGAARSAEPTARRARHAGIPYYHEYLRPKTPSGRGLLVNQAQFDAGTQHSNAIMIGSTNQLIERILDAQGTRHRPVLCTDRLGGLPKAAVEDSLNRYATEIASAVRATVTTSV